MTQPSSGELRTARPCLACHDLHADHILGLLPPAAPVHGERSCLQLPPLEGSTLPPAHWGLILPTSPRKPCQLQKLSVSPRPGSDHSANPPAGSCCVPTALYLLCPLASQCSENAGLVLKRGTRTFIARSPAARYLQATEGCSQLWGLSLSYGEGPAPAEEHICEVSKEMLP